MYHEIRIVLLLSLFLLPSRAFAQSTDTTATDTFRVQLSEVTVKAARSTITERDAGFALTVRERSPEDVALTPGTSLDELLRPLVGIWTNDRHHFALGERISVRGVGYRSNFGVRGIQVLYDGVPLTLPDGQAFLDVVDPAVTRTVELIRSPASVFWGNGSGGVLFLSSQPPASAPAVRARVQGGSFGQRQGVLEVTANTGPWSLHGYASGNRQNGYRDHSEGYRLRTGLNATRRFSSETELRLTAAGDVQDTENPSSLTLQQFREDPSQARPAFANVNAGKQSEQGQVGAALTHDLGPATFSGTGYYLYRSLENPLSFGTITYDRHSGGGRFTVRRTEGRIEGGVGVDAGRQSDDRVEYDSTTADGRAAGDINLNQVETVLSGSAFGYLRLNATSRLAVTGGLRVDRIRFEADDRLQTDGDQSGSRTFSAWSPTLGATYDLGTTQLFAQYSSAFETPTAAELSNRPGGGGGFNQQVAPQETQGFEVGARGTVSSARLQFDIALFRLQVNDLISSYEAPSGRDVYDNLAANTHDGIEASLTWQATRSLEVAARYTGSRFVISEAPSRSLVGNRVPGIPSRRVYLHTEVNHQGWWARLSGEGVSSYYADNANTAKAPRYVLVDLRLGHQGLQAGGLTFKPFVAVDNLLDERYASSVVVNAFGGRYYEPGPERSFSLGFNVEW